MFKRATSLLFSFHPFTLSLPRTRRYRNSFFFVPHFFGTPLPVLCFLPSCDLAHLKKKKNLISNLHWFFLISFLYSYSRLDLTWCLMRNVIEQKVRRHWKLVSLPIPFSVRSEWVQFPWDQRLFGQCHLHQPTRFLHLPVRGGIHRHLPIPDTRKELSG